ncbi:MAG: hypothetical protein ACPGPE_07340 [Planctomycetota bacterium]
MLPLTMELDSYENWRACLGVSCGIALTPAFIAERLAELGDPSHPKTQRFGRLDGRPHLEPTIGWFERAAQEAPAG